MRQNCYHTTHELFHAYRLGDLTAFDAVFKEFYPAICFFSSQLIGDNGAAKEIAEEAFVVAWQQRAEITNLKGFLYRKVKNDSLNWLRSEKRRKAREEKSVTGLKEGEELAWETLIQTEMLRSMQAAIDKMPLQRKKVFQLLYQEGKTVKEAAEILSVSISTVKDHKRSGILFLRKLLQMVLILLAQISFFAF